MKLRKLKYILIYIVLEKNFRTTEAKGMRQMVLFFHDKNIFSCEKKFKFFINDIFSNCY